MPTNYGLSSYTTGRSGGAPSSSGIGLPASGYSPGYGGIPNVPDPTSTAGSAIAGNMANLAKIYQMAGGINAFNTQAQISDLTAKIPNYQQLIMQNSGNIMSGLRGQLPQDVILQMLQRGAERGIQSGMAPGSANANAAYLRALGLNSLQLQGDAHNRLQQTIQNTPRADPFNVGSMLVTPDQMQAAATAQSIYNSAPNPEAAARAAMSAASAGMKRLSNGQLVPDVKLPGGSLGDKISMLGGPTGGTYWTSGSGPFTDPSKVVENYNNWRMGLGNFAGAGSTTGGGGAPPPYMAQGTGTYMPTNMMQYNQPNYSAPGSGYGYNPGYDLPSWQDTNWGVSYDLPNYGGGNWQDMDWSVGYNLPNSSAVGGYVGSLFDDSVDFGSILGSPVGEW